MEIDLPIVVVPRGGEMRELAHGEESAEESRERESEREKGDRSRGRRRSSLVEELMYLSCGRGGDVG